VEAEEERVPPIPGRSRPVSEIAVVGAGGDVAELVVGLVRRHRPRVRRPAEKWNQAMVADPVEEGPRERERSTRRRRTVKGGCRELDERDTLPCHALKRGHGGHIPRRLSTGELVADPRAPVKVLL